MNPSAAARPSPNAVRFATAAVAAAATAPVVAPMLALFSYPADACGDLGSLGAMISGWLMGLAVFAVTVVVVAVTLQRARILLVAVPVPVLHYVLAARSPQWPLTVEACGDSFSLLLPLLLAAVGGALTYALAPRVSAAN